MIKKCSLILSCLSAALFGSSTPDYFTESYDDTWSQRFQVQNHILEEKTDFQSVSVFDNPEFGRVLCLDGIIQLTEADEFVYHEMMAHPALVMHPNPKRVLIIGGGDGGVAREVLRHPSIECVDMVELDARVVEISREYFPTVCEGVFEDPRFNLLIQDGCKHIETHKNEYDVIIVDSTDPIGPSQVLFTSDFYLSCKEALRDGGYLICQNGCTFIQRDEFITSHQRRLEHFDWSSYYLAPVPTYIGGFMAYGIAGKSEALEQPKREEIEAKLKSINGSLKYYNEEIHPSAFALPNFLKDLMTTTDKS